MHDHNKINYKYDYQNIECNIHLIRDLEKCKNNTSHDWCDKFGIIGKLPAAIIRKVTGRKKEINRMVEILDDMQENNPEDFELLMDDFL